MTTVLSVLVHRSFELRCFFELVSIVIIRNYIICFNNNNCSIYIMALNLIHSHSHNRSWIQTPVTVLKQLKNIPNSTALINARNIHTVTNARTHATDERTSWHARTYMPKKYTGGSGEKWGGLLVREKIYIMFWGWTRRNRGRVVVGDRGGVPFRCQHTQRRLNKFSLFCFSP